MTEEDNLRAAVDTTLNIELILVTKISNMY
jgi:hypothetical protein